MVCPIPLGDLNDTHKKSDSTSIPTSCYVDLKQINTRWLYCVECPQYSTRLEVLGSRPKSARASSKQCTHSALNFIQIGSLPTEL